MGLHVTPRRVAWVDTVQGRVDALATMSLLQMISDAHDSVWQDGDLSSSSPNDAQVAIRDWLAYAHFLPPLPPKELSSLYSIQTEASSSTVSNLPKNHSRTRFLSICSLKLPQKRAYSRSTSSTSSSRSLLSSSPLKLWRQSTASLTTLFGCSIPTPPSPPSKSSSRSSRSLPVRSYTTPIYKKRPRFPTKIPSRQESMFDDVQVSSSSTSLESVFHPQNNIPTCRATHTHSTTSTPWLTRSFSSPNLNTSSSLVESSSRSTQKSVLDKNLSENRPPNVTLWTLLMVTVLGYLFFFFLFLGLFLFAVFKLFILRGTTDK